MYEHGRSGRSWNKSIPPNVKLHLTIVFLIDQPNIYFSALYIFSPGRCFHWCLKFSCMFYPTFIHSKTIAFSYICLYFLPTFWFYYLSITVPVSTHFFLLYWSWQTMNWLDLNFLCTTTPNATQLNSYKILKSVFFSHLKTLCSH